MQGAGGPALAAAVSDAGGLGILPTFGGSQAALRADIAATRQLTGRPFAVNITPMGRAFTESRTRVCIEEAVPIVTTGRADPGEMAVKALKQAGIVVLSVVPSVAHAKRMAQEGVDAVIASGAEAGGHVGAVATLPLVPQVVDALDIPVLAAGGIADARGFLAALALGAVGVQIGTRFIATRESDAADWFKQAVLALDETATCVSAALTGATVRCIATPDILAYERARRVGDTAQMKALSQRIRQRSYADPESGDIQHQGTMGQIAGLVREVRPVGEVIDGIVAEAAARLAEWSLS